MNLDNNENQGICIERRYHLFDLMSESENTEVPNLPQVPENAVTSPVSGNFAPMNNLGYNSYMYNNMNPYSGGNMFMGGGMFGSSMSSNNPHLPTGLQQSLSLLETVLITIGSTSQLIESSYIAAKGIMQTFREIHVQFQGLKRDCKNGILTAILYLKRILLLKRDNHRITADEKRSLKRLLIFIGLATGIPLVLKRMVNSAEQPVAFASDSSNIATNSDEALVNPSNAQFVKVLYDYTPPSITTGEMPIKKNEILAILSKKDALGNNSQWWKVRNKNGQTGYIPSNYIEILEKGKDQ